jgi:TonB family protein
MKIPFLCLWLAGTVLPLGALWLLFRLALRRERCFGYNRWLLLLAPLVAAGLPLLPSIGLPAWLLHSSLPGAVSLPAALPLAGPAAARLAPASPELSGLLWLYAAGVGLGLARLAYQGWQLHRATRHLARVQQAGYTLAYTGGRLPTSSFGTTIFWDETAGLTAAEATMVLAHELAHVRQHHSYDVLWLKLWQVVLWPNPFMPLLLPALRLTQELLADREALAQATKTTASQATTAYTGLLARLATQHFAGAAQSALLQPFTFSFTLLRLAMLQRRQPVRRWKQWLLAPVVGGLLLVACQTAPEQPAPPVPAVKAPEAPEAPKPIDARLAALGRQQAGRAATPAEQRERAYLEALRTPAVESKLAEEIREATTLGRSQVKGYTYVEQMPQLPGGGGTGAIVQAVLARLVWPVGSPDDDSIGGRVFAQFTVDAAGNVRNARIIKGLSPAFDAATLAAIAKLPHFVPGRQNGRPVAVSFTLPVSFEPQ